MYFIDQFRDTLWDPDWRSESKVVNSHLAELQLHREARERINVEAVHLVNGIRQEQNAGLLASFLVEYGLSTSEGIALMCLAEALLRVPDADTIDELISDKLAAANWGQHLGHSSSSLVNASTWALMLTGKILKSDDSHDIAQTMQQVLKRLGEPVVRVAVAKAIELIANQYILGQDIESAQTRARQWADKGYQFSYDMLGETAVTWHDANRYWESYASAITYLAQHCHSNHVRDNPGISVKLSALHPRCHSTHRDNVAATLQAATLKLARAAKDANMGFNIDAEEFDKLYLFLDVISGVLSDPQLAKWHGFGVVIQAYSPYALPIIDYVNQLAKHLDRHIMVRLVKGAYWDTEIKRAQVQGLKTYPVFTRKSSTDLSYLVCAQRLLALNDRIYPQFATHNVHTIRCVLELAKDTNDFEFQRLHGMGEEVHEVVRAKFGYRCRIYAPVGKHRDLLAYLVRRILENGANSSFVHQLMDLRIPVEHIVSDPVEQTMQYDSIIENPTIPTPEWIYGHSRKNSHGFDLANEAERLRLEEDMNQFAGHYWVAKDQGDRDSTSTQVEKRFSPTDTRWAVGEVMLTEPDDLSPLIAEVFDNGTRWSQTNAGDRANLLDRVAQAYEQNIVELMVLLIRESGKTIADALSEVREAIDFCRYYANEARKLDHVSYPSECRGIIVCISPWNFPLAIFTGQIVAALAAGNPVIAKPAEQAPLIGARAMELMHRAGVPKLAATIVYGTGEIVGAPVVSDARIAGVNFTGSTETAQLIHRSIARQGNPLAKLIAETGGLNAMIVDSTALPEQAVQDIVVSAFQSAGQRCSALRMLYIQEEIKAQICEMLFGAMELLVVGDPWHIETDIGPVIDADAKTRIDNYVDKMEAKGLLHYRTPLAKDLQGHFVAPCVIEVGGIQDLEGEVFGPVLHLASYRSDDLPNVIETINRSGYGLTFGMHSRIDQRVQQITESVDAGNIYVNRNQIGAVVGCQPFGGRGLSGTGPKAGGPHYVPTLRQYRQAGTRIYGGTAPLRSNLQAELQLLSQWQRTWAERTDREARLCRATKNDPEFLKACQQTFECIKSPVDLDAPTGESNRLYLEPKGVFVCIGSSMHVIQALAAGNAVLAIGIASERLDTLAAVDAPVIASQYVPDAATVRSQAALAGICFETCDRELVGNLRCELASRDGPIVQFIIDQWAPSQFVTEKTLCIDTTAAGGNARLLIESGS